MNSKKKTQHLLLSCIINLSSKDKEKKKEREREREKAPPTTPHQQSPKEKTQLLIT